MEYLDVMIDLETTGTQPERAGILQLAAVRFDYASGQIDPNMFNAAMSPAPGRLWDFSTIVWWREEAGRMAHLNTLMKTGRPADVVMKELIAWVGNPSQPVRMWAKPTSFEGPFLSSLFEQLGMQNCFHYRHMRDINTWISALRGDPAQDRSAVEVPFEGQPHNALFDALHDVRVLLAAKDFYAK